MKTRIDGQELSPDVIEEMRGWALDCEWMDREEIGEMEAAAIVAGVERYYEGGVAGFLAAS